MAQMTKSDFRRVLMDIGAVQMAVGLGATIYFLFIDADNIHTGLFLTLFGFTLFLGAAKFGFFKGEQS